MWGTDATSTYTSEHGNVTVFAAIDHHTGECVGIHVAIIGNRFEALEPIRQGIREHFGSYQKKSARGLILRHDHGSQYMSRHFQKEIKFLGAISSPSFVRQPEGNGVIERFFRTLKEQLLWISILKRLMNWSVHSMNLSIGIIIIGSCSDTATVHPNRCGMSGRLI
jgi:transposase InsO family protein